MLVNLWPCVYLCVVVIFNTQVPTFLLSFAEEGLMLADGQQSDVIVIDDVLRVFEPVVSAQKMMIRCPLKRATLVAQNDVENLN